MSIRIPSYPPIYMAKAPATLSQNNPVSGTQYTVLDTTANVKIVSAYVAVTWTVQPSPLEMHITIDGQSLTFTFTNPVSTTKYYPNLDAGLAASAQPLSTTVDASVRSLLMEGRSVKVEVETTGGTTSNLAATVMYSTLPK